MRQRGGRRCCPKSPPKLPAISPDQVVTASSSTRISVTRAVGSWQALMPRSILVRIYSVFSVPSVVPSSFGIPLTIATVEKTTCFKRFIPQSCILRTGKKSTTENAEDTKEKQKARQLGGRWTIIQSRHHFMREETTAQTQYFASIAKFDAVRVAHDLTSDLLARQYNFAWTQKSASNLLPIVSTALCRDDLAGW